MAHPLTYPADMPGFKPYTVSSAHIQSADETIYHAALGSLGDDKATFRVYCWTEKPDGTLTQLELDAPPNNAPTFAVVNGRLILYGVLDDSAGRRLIQCDVGPFVDRVAWAIYNANGAIAGALTRENQRLALLAGAG